MCVCVCVCVRVCIYKIAEVSVINIHENDNANKTLLKLLCIPDIKKKIWVGKNLYDLIEIKGKYEVKI